MIIAPLNVVNKTFLVLQKLSQMDLRYCKCMTGVTFHNDFTG